MKNEMMLFESKQVEVFEFDGKVLFNPYHVGECLELSEEAVRKQMQRMSEKQIVKLKNSDFSNGTNCPNRKFHNTGENFLTESGVYKMIFISRSEGAEKFQDWVTDEVLPSIRKNGGYIQNQEQLTPEQIVANALVVAQNIIANQNNQIAEMKPKVDGYEDLLSTKGNHTMNEVAKIIGMGRNKLFQILRENKLLMKNNLPYQEYVDRDYFSVREVVIKRSEYDDIKRQTLVTTKGLDYINKRIKNWI